MCWYPTTLYPCHNATPHGGFLCHLQMAFTCHNLYEGGPWLNLWSHVFTFYTFLDQISNSRVCFILVYFLDISTRPKYNASRLFHTSSWNMTTMVRHFLQYSKIFLLYHHPYHHAWHSLYLPQPSSILQVRIAYSQQLLSLFLCYILCKQTSLKHDHIYASKQAYMCSVISILCYTDLRYQINNF